MATDQGYQNLSYYISRVADVFTSISATFATQLSAADGAIFKEVTGRLNNVISDIPKAYAEYKQGGVTQVLASVGIDAVSQRAIVTASTESALAAARAALPYGPEGVRIVPPAARSRWVTAERSTATN